METQRIQYAKSTDGTDIAYAVIGFGPPLLVVEVFVQAGLDLRLRRFSTFYETLRLRRSLVVFDWRGSGLSGPATEFSLTTLASDLESIMTHAGFDEFDLLAVASPCHVALEFAASRPTQVRKMVLSNPSQKGRGPAQAPSMEPLIHLARNDWDVFTVAYAVTSVGWTDSGRQFMEQLRQHWTPESFLSFMTAVEGFDAFPRAPAVRGEVLVISNRSNPWPRSVARQLVASLPDGHLHLSDHGARSGEEALLIAEFLGEWERPVSIPEFPVYTGSFRTILFTDIEGHTQMMQRLGDAKGREVLRGHERTTREALATHNGAEIKTMGDGFMASFGSAQKALECAIALQKAFAGREGEPVRIRVGINAGEPIAEDDDLFGSSVILAARTAAKANGGEILVTDVVRQLVAGKGFAFSDRGETEMRGFEEPVRLYEVHWN